MTQDDFINDAVSRLNPKNLVDLWLTQSVLSLVDYFGQDQSVINPLSPYLNLQIISLFGDAIIRSAANYESQEPFTSADAVPVLNALKQAEDIGAVEFLQAENIEGAEMRLLRWISVVSFSQFRFQTRDIGQRVARSYASLDIIPSRHRERLQARYGQRFIDIPAEFEHRFGISLKHFFQCTFRLLVFYKTRHDDLNITERLKTILQPFSLDTPSGKQAYEEAFLALIDESKFVYGSLAFRSDTLLLPGNDPLSEETVQAFLDLTARDTQFLRDMHQKEPAARVGYYGHRLSPLEMHPIIEMSLEKVRRYVVPNLRYLDQAITQIPHFALMRVFPNNEYNEQLGTIQELYLEDLVRSRLSSLSVIPEKAYGKPQVHGPDLTLIDMDANGLIVIESKAKRMRAPTKVDPLSDELMSDLAAGFAALKKLDAKIQHLFQGIPAYKDFQNQINLTKSKKPVRVIVLGEGVFSLSHVLEFILDQEPDHFLSTVPYPYCFMSVDVFERAVEVAASNDISLYHILVEYWQISRDRSAKPYPAEEFEGRKIKPDERYLRKYERMFLESFTAEK